MFNRIAYFSLPPSIFNPFTRFITIKRREGASYRIVTRAKFIANKCNICFNTCLLVVNVNELGKEQVFLSLVSLERVDINYNGK